MWNVLGIICLVVAVLFVVLVTYSLCWIAGKLSRQEESEQAKIQSTVGINADKDESLKGKS